MGTFVSIIAMIFITCIVVDLIVLNILVMKLLDFKDEVEDRMHYVNDWFTNTDRKICIKINRLVFELRQLLEKFDKND